MRKIMIGDYLVRSDDIESISERDVTLNVKVTKPNPKPKPTKGLAKMFYSSTVTTMEAHKYRILVLKVAAGTRTILPDPNDDSDFSVGSISYGTHTHYNYYTICDNAKLVSDAKALLKECDSIGVPRNLNEASRQRPEVENRRSEIIKTLRQLGMDYSFDGWLVPDYLDTRILIDRDIKSKQSFIDKYM